MADSLDDFFAKKDKKKGKGKAVLSAETLVKELEEGAKKTEYPVRKEAKTSTAIELLGLDADDADWRDFEDMEKRDYTGLKVKEMSLQDQTEEDQRRLSADQTDSVPDATAWRIKDDSAPAEEPAPSAPQPKAPITSAAAAVNPASTAATAAAAAAAAATTTTSTTSDSTKSSTPVGDGSDKPTDEKDTDAKTSQASSENPEKKGDKPSAKPSVYVPPHERNLMAGGTGEVRLLEPMRLSKTKTTSTRHEKIPDIQDEQAFPSLG